MRHNVVVRAEFVKEGGLFVGLAPDLNVSSFGETLEEAKGSQQEAVDGFLEECAAMVTLEEVLEEAGFGQKQGIWLPRQPVAAELLTAG
jgi:predicted RNase H-like HicB family nuclease